MTPEDIAARMVEDERARNAAHLADVEASVRRIGADVRAGRTTPRPPQTWAQVKDEERAEALGEQRAEDARWASDGDMDRAAAKSAWRESGP